MGRQTRTLRALGIVAAVVGTFYLARPPAAAANHGACGAGSTEYRVWEGKYYGDIPGDVPVNGAYAESVVRSLVPCSPGSDGATYIFAAGIRGLNSCEEVKLGYGKRSGGALEFFYTPGDGVCGTVDYASTWYWIGDNRPIIGHRYWFVIDQVTSVPGATWRYCIKDMTAGTIQVCGETIGSWVKGSWARWSYETHDAGDVMGTSGGNATSPLTPLRYHYGSFASQPWIIRTGLPACSRTGSPPSKYSCHVYTTTYPSDSFYTHTH